MTRDQKEGMWWSTRYRCCKRCKHWKKDVIDKDVGICKNKKLDNKVIIGFLMPLYTHKDFGCIFYVEK